MSEGQIAGRLEVPVESSTKGFKKKLEGKVNEAAKNVEAKVGVSLKTKGLRKKLQAAVDEAAVGVKAKIGVELDDASVADLKAKLEAVAIASGTKVKVAADGDLVGEVARKAAEAQAGADARPVHVPLRARAAAFLREVFTARAEAQAAVDAEPVKIPVKAGRGKGFGLRGHTLMRVGMYSGLASMIEPLLGGIGQIVGGLGAMAGAAAPAVGTVEALPAALGGGIQGMIGLKLATSGVGQALSAYTRAQHAAANGTKLTKAQQDKLDQSMKELSPHTRQFVKDLTGLRSKWVQVRKGLQEPIFTALDKQLKPLVDKTLPTFARGLTQTDTIIGRLITKTGRWMQTPMFNQQFAGAMRQNNHTLGAMGGALLDVAKGMTWFYRASAPFQKRMDHYIAGWGKWFLNMAKGNAQNGDTLRFLDKATNRLSLLWDITKQFGGGLAGIFRAGDASGMRLLHTFDSFLTDWRTWVDSTQGQNYLADWFTSTETGFTEIARLVDDTFKGIAHWAADPKIAHLIHQIRTEFGPALGHFLQALSQHMGGNVIDLLTQLTRLLNNAEPAIEVMANLTTGLLDLAGALNTLMEKGGGFTDAVMKIVGGLLLFRSVKGIGGKLGAGALGGLLGRRGAAAAAGGAAEAGGIGLAESLGLGALLGGAGVKGASKGGLLRRLFRGGTKAVGKHGAFVVNSAGEVAAPEMFGASGASKALYGVAKSPLMKKAGWIGFALTAIDLYNKGKGDFHSFSGLRDTYGRTLGPHGRANRLSMQAVSRALSQGENISKYAGDLGFSTSALARGLASGGSKDPYVQALMKRLRGKTSGFMGGLRNSLAILNPVGDNQTFRAGLVLKDLKKITKQIDATRAAATHSGNPLNTMFAGVSKAVGKANAAMVKFNKRISGLPTHIQTLIKTPGLIRSMNRVKILSDLYHLTPKQVTTFLSTSGVVKTMKDVRKAQRMFHLTPRQIVTLIKQSGVKPTLAEVVRLQKRYHLTPKRVATLLKATGVPLSEALAKRLQHRYHMTPHQKTTFLKAIDRASKVIDHVVWGLGRIHSKTVHVAVEESRIFKMNHLPGTRSADGSTVPKDGGPYADRYPYLLAPGEEVTSNRSGQADRARRALKLINKGWLTDKMLGLADGGTVRGLAHGGTVTKGWLNGNFKWALAQGVGNVLNEQHRLERKIGRRRERAFNHRFRLLKKEAEKRAKLADRMDRATARLTDLKDFKRAMTEGLRGSAKSYGSLSGIGSQWGGFLSPHALIGELQRRASSAYHFRKNMGTLRSKGLSRLAYEQLAAAGFKDGGPLAEQLAHASRAQIHTINHLQSRIVHNAAVLGRNGMKGYYKAGIDTANGLVHGLQSRQKALNKTAKKMAASMVKAIKHRLRIHSPSRETFEVGAFTADGLGLGLDHRKQRLMEKARGIAAELAANLNPGDTHSARHMATLAASGRHSFAGLARHLPPQLAPLVGELIIQGKSDEEVKNALEEAMFQLRTIRQGGVHAERIA